MNETTAATGPEDKEDKSIVVTTISKLLFPIIVIVLSIMYINATLGEIQLTPNLVYPYFFISLGLLISSIVIISELTDIFSDEYKINTKEQLETWWSESHQAILLVGIIIAYPILIGIIGYYIASLIIILSCMYVGNYRDRKMMLAGTALILAAVYILFGMVLGLSPPEGPLGV